jgi:hypothetical protein
MFSASLAIETFGKLFPIPFFFFLDIPETKEDFVLLAQVVPG